MDKFRSVIAATALATSACFSSMAGATNNIQLLVNGLAAPNLATPPSTTAFTTWCSGVCFPTTNQPAYDPGTGQLKGAI